MAWRREDSGRWLSEGDGGPSFLHEGQEVLRQNGIFPRVTGGLGFDFVASKVVDGAMLLRPVQVKGLYPTLEKTNKQVYGFVGSLSATHPDMVLALPYFAAHERGTAPEHIAYMPLAAVKVLSDGGHRCQPAKFGGGRILTLPHFKHFFGQAGLDAVAQTGWGKTAPIVGE
jgi:hypothetical protein